MVTAEFIKQKAQELGFFACGIAKAERVSKEEEKRLRTWLHNGMNAGMTYMSNYFDKRIDPLLLMEGVKSIVCVAMNYAQKKTLPKGEPQIATYALGKDYHNVLKKRLHALAEEIYSNNTLSEQNHRRNSLLDSSSRRYDNDGNIRQKTTPRYRIFVDSGPVLERYWAEKAGIGWIGKNQLLIIPFAGCMFFLGELFLDIELTYDKPIKNKCGSCRRCIDHCPTGALSLTDGVNANLCLSYQTIENRGPLTKEAKEAMGNVFYGCDRCQLACPWNRFAQTNNIPEFQPSNELLTMTRDKWENLTEEQYRTLFKGSAVKRAKYAGLMRNIRALSKLTPKETKI